MRTPNGHAGQAGIPVADLNRSKAFTLSAILLPTNSSFDDPETMSTFHRTIDQGWAIGIAPTTTFGRRRPVAPAATG
jgi:hypothetical protein